MDVGFSQDRSNYLAPQSGGGGGSSMDPFTIGAGVIGGIASLFGGGGGEKQQSGYELPPEYELQFLQQIQQNLSQTNEQYAQITQLTQEYQNRINTAYSAMQGTIPSADALKNMTQSNIRLSQALGLSAEDMVKNGFMTKDDQAQLQQYHDAAQGKLEDPGLKQQHNEQRRQLQQDLQRQGVPMAQQQIALQQFDAGARSESFNRSLQLGQGIAQGIGLSQGLRQQGFNQALGTSQNFMQQIGQAQGGIGALAGLAGQGFQVGAGAVGIQQQLLASQSQQYKDLGQFQLSNSTKDLLTRGTVGPGTVRDQSGQPTLDPNTMAMSRNQPQVRPSFVGDLSRMSDAQIMAGRKQYSPSPYGGTSDQMQRSQAYGSYQDEASKRNLLKYT